MSMYSHFRTGAAWMVRINLGFDCKAVGKRIQRGPSRGYPES